PRDEAHRISPLPARAAVGRQQRAIWAQAWSVSSWRLPPVLLGRLSAGQPKPTDQASSAGPSRGGGYQRVVPVRVGSEAWSTPSSLRGRSSLCWGSPTR